MPPKETEEQKRFLTTLSPAIHRWLDSKSTRTTVSYKWGLYKFYQLMQVHPDDVLAMRRQEVEKNLIKAECKVRQLVIDATQAFKDEGNQSLAVLVNTTVRSMVTNVLGKRWMLDLESEQYVRERAEFIPTRSELQRLIANADLEESIRLLWFACSGMRIGDARRVTWGQVATELERCRADPLRSLAIHYTPQKKVGGKRLSTRITFLTPELTRLILDKRTRLIVKGASLDGLSKQPIIDVTSETVNRVLRNLLKRAEINIGESRFSSHCLRKYFIDYLHPKDNAKTDFMVGHKPAGISEEHYRRSHTEQTLREFYDPHRHYFSLEESDEGKRVTELEQSVSGLWEIIEQLKWILSKSPQTRELLLDEFEAIEQDIDAKLKRIKGGER